MTTYDNIYFYKEEDGNSIYLDVNDNDMKESNIRFYIHALQNMAFLIDKELNLPKADNEHPLYVVAAEMFDAGDEDFYSARIFQEGDLVILSLLDPERDEQNTYSNKRDLTEAQFKVSAFVSELFAQAYDHYGHTSFDADNGHNELDCNSFCIDFNDWRPLIVMIGRYAAAKGYSVDLFGIEGPKGPLPFSLLDSFDYFNEFANTHGLMILPQPPLDPAEHARPGDDFNPTVFN